MFLFNQQSRKKSYKLLKLCKIQVSTKFLFNSWLDQIRLLKVMFNLVPVQRRGKLKKMRRNKNKFKKCRKAKTKMKLRGSWFRRNQVNLTCSTLILNVIFCPTFNTFCVFSLPRSFSIIWNQILEGRLAFPFYLILRKS